MLKTFFEKVLSWIFINRCCFCHEIQEDSLLCSKCKAKIKFLSFAPSFIIENCEVFSVCLYEGIIKKLIHLVKYKKKNKLAINQAQIMQEYWKELGQNKHYTVIPVPMHKKRQKQRGENHMNVVGQEFSRLMNYDFSSDFILRIKDTKPQYKLTKAQREVNLKDAFALNNINMPDKSTPLLIIDDIKTTGSTLREIILLLKANGYHDITAFTTART